MPNDANLVSGSEPASTIGHILVLLEKYPFIVPIITASVSGAVSFALGRWSHQRQLDKDASNVHFVDIKEHVITPLLNIISLSSRNTLLLLSIDEAEKEGRLSSPPALSSSEYLEEYDSSLLTDFLENHYPMVKDLWNDVIKNHTEAAIKDKQLKEIIRDNLEAELNSYGIQYSDANTKQNDMLEPIDQLYDRLTRLIIEEKYEDSVLQQLATPDVITFQQVTIYRCATSNGSVFLTDLRNICNSITTDGQVRETLNAYKHSIQSKKDAYQDFRYELKIIQRKTNLNFEKEWLIRGKCRFVKPKLS